MSKFLSFLRPKAADAPQQARVSGARQKMLFIAVLGVAALCYMVASPVQDIKEVAYRMSWLVLTGVALAFIYCINYSKQELNVTRTILVVLLILAQMVLIHIFNILRVALPGNFTLGQMLLVLPYALAPSITAVMLGRKMAVYVALCTSLFGMVLMPLDCPPVILADYLVISLLVGFVSAVLCSRVHKREQIAYAGFITGLITFTAAIALGSFRDTGLASIHDGFSISGFTLEALASIGFGFLVLVIIGGITPLLEGWFNISTHIRWLEWADMNHPVLKKLQMVAPGTFHHSLCVQRLAEAAAEAIGADVTRAGVCGLYHDIGKLRNPQFFAENIADQRFSPHGELTPEASARLIIQHVQDGIEIARDHHLNSRIINVIREHHGTSTAYFFYRKAMDQYEEAKAKFDEGLIDTCPEPVNKAIFTYKGPVPQTRESGIVSMADAVESATRSLVNPSEQDIRSMIDGIFKGRILDGHLQDCQITLGDIAKMKEAFFTTLRTMNHNRIAYPKPKAEETEDLLEQERQKKETPVQQQSSASEGSAKAAS